MGEECWGRRIQIIADDGEVDSDCGGGDFDHADPQALGIQGTSHPTSAFVEDMSVDHRGFDILVT